MRAITLLASMVVLFVSCNCQKAASEKTETAVTADTSSETTTPATEMKQENLMPVLEYQANTRGFFIKVRVENQNLYVSRNRDAQKLMKATPINDADWKEIETLAKAVNLQSVKEFKGPTEKRFYDGAAIANLTFIDGRAQYPTNDFDHGFPPKEIEKLVNKIVALAEKTE